MKRRVLIMLNPKAGQGGSLAKAALALSRRQSLDLELVVPRPADPTEQLAQARAEIDSGVDAVIVHGGDGAVQIGFNLVAGTGIPLGIVPAGTGNDFARSLGINRKDSTKALEDILDALKGEIITTEVDGLKVSISGSASGERWVANSVNIGFDARVNQVANAMKHVPGSLRYGVALAREVPRFEQFTVDGVMDGKVARSVSTSLICIQNGPFIGGGIPFSLGSRPDDGTFDLSFVHSSSKTALVTLFPLVYARMHWAIGPLTQHRGRHVTLSLPAEIPVFADGDEVLDGRQGPTSVTIDLVRRAVKILLPHPHLAVPEGRFTSRRNS